MAKITIRRTDGSELFLEDLNQDEFDRLTGADPADSVPDTGKHDGDSRPDAPMMGKQLESDLRRRLDVASPTTAQEYAVVLAAAAVDFGLLGLDRSLAEVFATMMGNPPPRSWRGTFSNAHAAGLLEKNVHERWVPTEAGRRIAMRRNQPPSAGARRRSS